MLCKLKNLHRSIKTFFSNHNLSNPPQFCRSSMDSPVDTSSGSQNWRGVSTSELFGSDSPWGAPEFPLISPAYNHAVLYHISSTGTHDSGRPPKAQVGQDKWDHEYVRMPCSDHSLYPVEDEGSTSLKRRWEIIKEALERPIKDSEQLANAILSYNTKFRTVWRFQALHALFNDHLEEEETQYFFNVTLPEVAKLALALPKLIQAPIPLLKQHKNRSISLSQQQIASLLANAFFCTYPRRNTTKRSSEYASYPHINFNVLYESAPSESVLEKLKCLCHYFRRVCTKVPIGVLTFMRRSVPPRNCPDWSKSSTLIGATPLHVNSSGKIEDDGLGMIQVDFANKYLGGGVLGRGCVQEEIRFVICPELLISMLFTEVLRPNESLIMIGCERYSKYTGYGSTFRWAGDFLDATPRDSSMRRRCVVLAIDALPFSNKANQYFPQFITREINKAWVGFSCYISEDDLSIQRPGVATGNWGCGAFGGTPNLKFLLQLIAASEARRPMAYYTFGDVELRNSLIGMYNLLAKYNVTVGELFGYVKLFASSKVPRSQLYAYIHQYIMDREKKPPSQPKCESDDAMDTSEPLNHTDKDKSTRTDNSPDLFSQDSDDNQEVNKEIPSIPSTMDLKNSCKPKKDGANRPLMFFNNSTKPREEVNKPLKKAINEISTVKDEINKPKVSTVQTRRLFEEMSKFDEESGKVHFDVAFPDTDTHFDLRKQDETAKAVQNDNASISDSLHEVKLTIGSDDVFKSDISNDVLSQSDMNASQLDNASEIDKCLERNNATVSQSDFEGDIGNRSQNETSFRQNSAKKTPKTVKDELLNTSDLANDVKKQLTKKITDYFSKKSQ